MNQSHHNKNTNYSKWGIGFQLRNRKYKNTSQKKKNVYRKSNNSNPSVNTQSVNSNSTTKFINFNNCDDIKRKSELIEYSNQTPFSHNPEDQQKNLFQMDEQRFIETEKLNSQSCIKKHRNSKHNFNQTVLKPVSFSSMQKSWDSRSRNNQTFHSNNPESVYHARYPAFIPNVQQQKNIPLSLPSFIHIAPSTNSQYKLKDESPHNLSAQFSHQSFPSRKRKPGVSVLVNMLIKHVRNQQKQMNIMKIHQLQEQEAKRKELIRAKQNPIKINKTGKTDSIIYSKIRQKRRSINKVEFVVRN